MTVRHKDQCRGCVLLRKQLVEALQLVDFDDWGARPRSVRAVLTDIASRLQYQGEPRVIFDALDDMEVEDA